MGIVLKILLFFSILYLISAYSEGRRRKKGEKPYPWIYTTNPCKDRKVNPSIYDHCYTPNQNKCNSTVCCLGLTPNTPDAYQCLNNRNCTYFVHYEYEGPVNITNTTTGNWSLKLEHLPVKVKYNMTSLRPTPHYMAYALSRNDKMGNDLVFVCELKKDKNVSFYLRWNHQRKNLRANSKVKDIATLIRAEYDVNLDETHCDFILHPIIHYVHLNPAWNFTLVKDNQFHDKYYGLLAAGTVLPNGDLGNHEHVYITGHVNNPWTYTNQCIVEPGYSPYLQEKYHASFMVAVWILVIPLNTYIVRYFKTTFAIPCFRFGPVWLVVHQLLSILSFLMTMTAYIIIGGDRNYEVAKYKPATYHSAFGFFTIASFLLEMCLGACRIRFLSNSILFRVQRFHAVLHFWVLFMGYLTIGISPYWTYNVLPCGIYHAIYPFILVQVAFHVIMVRDHQKTDMHLGFDPDRSRWNYPLLIGYHESRYRHISWKRLLILGSYTMASIGFGLLILGNLIFGDIFGPPCLPHYNHIPIARRAHIVT